MVSVVIADDQPIIRRALQELFADAADIELVGAAGNGDDALAQVVDATPDVLLTDLDMPGLSGVDVIAEVTRRKLATRCLALTTFSAMDWVVPALRTGASGYLVKDAPPEDIMDAIREVMADTRVLSPSIVDLLVENVRREPTAGAESGPDSTVPDLQVPPREMDVLRLLAGGLSNREIAAQLFLSESSVKSYLSKLCTRLGARDRVQLVVRGVEWGLVSARLLNQEPGGV